MNKPTFKQMEEFHEQTKSGRITQENLQAFLRDPNRGQTPSLVDTTGLLSKGWTYTALVLSEFDVGQPGPGVELRAHDGRLHRPDLYWSGKHWYVDLDCLGYSWLICGQATSRGGH